MLLLIGIQYDTNINSPFYVRINAMSAARPILIVEDDNTLRQVLTDQFAGHDGFFVTEAATLAEASRHLAMPEARCDAIILDIGLPDGDGRDFCIKIRQQGHMMPILMLTGATAEDAIVSGLNAGANDYIVKPFRGNELLARLQAQLRRFDTSAAAVFTIGPYFFRPAVQLLVRADTKQRIHLTSKEVAIIKFFYRHPNQDVSRQMLMQQVWGYNAGVTSHTLETHIYRLRQKINSTDHRLLMTIPGGYRFDLASG